MDTVEDVALIESLFLQCQEAPDRVRVFVYGSLRRGFWNFDRFELAEDLACGEAILSSYALFVTHGQYPYLGQAPDGSVRGEIYAMSREKARAIAWMECGAGYLPAVVAPQLVDRGEPIRALTFIGRPEILVSARPYGQMSWDGPSG